MPESIIREALAPEQQELQIRQSGEMHQSAIRDLPAAQFQFLKRSELWQACETGVRDAILLDVEPPQPAARR